MSCVINLAVSLSVPFIGSETGSRNGFCTIKQSLSGIIVFSSGVLFVLSILSLSHFLVLVVFALLIKSNEVSMENAECPSSIKKAIMKVLAFHVVREICLLIQLVVNTNIFRDKVFEDTSSITRFIVYYAVGEFYRLTVVLTPVSLSVYLKLTWDCLRKMIKKLCSLCLPCKGSTRV